MNAKHDMETIREALCEVLGEGDWAVSRRILSSAIDELEALRNQPDDGSYLDRASLLARIETLTNALDTAKAEAARLREALGGLEWCIGWSDTMQQWVCVGRERMMVALDLARKALAATDSGEWLAKHDEEVTEPLRKRIAELENRIGHGPRCGPTERGTDFMCRCGVARAVTSEKRVTELEAQLAAATNDAARAELRARELREALENSCTPSSESCKKCVWDTSDELHLCSAHAALEEQDTPDSDARLREVMTAAVEAAILDCGHEVDDEWVKKRVDFALGVKS